MASLDPFDAIVVGDFEFGGPDGMPEIRCAVFHDLRTGSTTRLWVDELRRLPGPPFDVGPRSLFVGHYASAELNCFRMLGWPSPANVLDTYVEFRRLMNGIGAGRGGYLNLLAHYREGAMSAEEKDEMRDLALRGGDYTAEERKSLLDYCEGDVIPLAKILPRLVADIDLGLSLGFDQHYVKAVSNLEGRGIPLDAPLVRRFIEALDEIKVMLPRDVDPDGLIYDGTRFVASRFMAYVSALHIPWPILESGSPDLKDDTFRQMAKIYPKELGPIRETRHVLGQMKLASLCLCPDGRNRCMTSYYGTVTSRNTPSTAKFIFGSARWARSFIKPDHGMAVAYLDWSAQEYRVAASLSGDLEMLDDCQGDPYIRGAIRMSLAPKGATKSSHSALRGQFKVVALAALYGMGAATLAGRLGVHIRRANELLELHRLIYRRYWEWSGNVTSRAWGSGLLTSRYGWKFGLTDETKPTTVMNWHIQTAGAEMLRHALILAEANGVRVIALVHDALMIEAPVDQIHTEVARMRECMEVASTKLLENTRVPTSCEIIAHPDRYRDEKDREAEMWPRMNRLLEQVETRRNRGRIIVPASTF